MMQIGALAVFAVLTAAAAAFAALFEPGAWYARLAKPAWTPPDAIFAPVWTVLYLMIAIAGWLVWRAGDRGRALGYWVAQLGLNALWPWLFFGLHAIGLALLDIVLLWLAIMGFVLSARGRSNIASLLFIPYLAWVSYAALVNMAIMQLNYYP